MSGGFTISKVHISFILIGNQGSEQLKPLTGSKQTTNTGQISGDIPLFVCSVSWLVGFTAPSTQIGHTRAVGTYKSLQASIRLSLSVLISLLSFTKQIV